MTLIHAWRFYDKLLEAGIVSEPAERVKKLSIIADADEAVRIELEFYADEKVAEVLIENLQGVIGSGL